MGGVPSYVRARTRLEHCRVMRLVIERVPTSPGLGDRVDGVEYLSEDQAHADRDLGSACVLMGKLFWGQRISAMMWSGLWLMRHLC